MRTVRRRPCRKTLPISWAPSRGRRIWGATQDKYLVYPDRRARRRSGIRTILCDTGSLVACRESFSRSGIYAECVDGLRRGGSASVQVSGEVAPRSMAGCKSVGLAYPGSNPGPATSSENSPRPASTLPGAVACSGDRLPRDSPLITAVTGTLMARRGMAPDRVVIMDAVIQTHGRHVASSLPRAGVITSRTSGRGWGAGSCGRQRPVAVTDRVRAGTAVPTVGVVITELGDDWWCLRSGWW
jgi:hypothetical protein